MSSTSSLFFLHDHGGRDLERRGSPLLLPIEEKSVRHRLFFFSVFPLANRATSRPTSCSENFPPRPTGRLSPAFFSSLRLPEPSRLGALSTFFFFPAFPRAG